MLDIGVMLWVIRHQMVDIVIVLPPTEAETSHPVSNHCPEYAVCHIVSRDAGMSCIMRNDFAAVSSDSQRQI